MVINKNVKNFKLKNMKNWVQVRTQEQCNEVCDFYGWDLYKSFLRFGYKTIISIKEEFYGSIDILDKPQDIIVFEEWQKQRTIK